MTAKNHSAWADYLRASERSCLALSENAMDYELPLGRCQPSEIQGFGILLLTQQFFIISTLVISLTVTAKPINHIIF